MTTKRNKDLFFNIDYEMFLLNKEAEKKSREISCKVEKKRKLIK